MAKTPDMPMPETFRATRAAFFRDAMINRNLFIRALVVPTPPDPDIMAPLADALAVLGLEDTPAHREWLLKTASELPDV